MIEMTDAKGETVLVNEKKILFVSTDRDEEGNLTENSLIVFGPDSWLRVWGRPHTLKL